MTSASERVLQCSGAAAEALIAGYDRETGDWAFPRDSPFFDAVAEAHRRGERGAGRHVAILDSAFDLSLPALASGTRVCLPGRPGADLSHGTAVALLVRTVAPDAILHLYAIGGPDGPDRHAVATALRKLADSEAQIVCLSLGVPVPLSEVTLAPHDRRMLAARPRNCPTPGRCLCDAVQAAIAGVPSLAGATGRTRAVFAAVGNDPGSLFCPAMAHDAFAIGFQQEQRVADPVRGESAWATGTSGYGQSAAGDYTLMQPATVLGSSFATPLVAGAAALQADLDAIAGMQRACARGAVADIFLARHRTDRAAGTSALESALAFHGEAVRDFPHRAAIEGGRHWCIGCALYGGSLFVNAGLAHLEAGAPARAETLLRVARRIAPRSADAAANLAMCLMHLAEGAHTDTGRRQLREAVAAFDEAIALRPGYRGYDPAREHALRRLSLPGTAPD